MLPGASVEEAGDEAVSMRIIVNDEIAALHPQ